MVEASSLRSVSSCICSTGLGLHGQVTIEIEDDHAVRKERPFYSQAGTPDYRPEAMERVIRREALD